jgi:hypothetical protein
MACLTNEVLDGVIAAIADEFDPIPVYDEQVEQGMPEPSFAVRSIHPRQALFLNRRYKRVELIEVVYFPPNGEGRKRNTNEVLEKLFSILEIIQAGDDTIRGTDMDAHIDDENHVGVFTVNYKYFVDSDDESEKPAITELDLKGVTLK